VSLAPPDLFAALGGGAAVFSRWPQVWRLWVVRHHQGLSLRAAIFGVLSGLCWTGYGVTLDRPAQILANGFVTVSAVALLAGLVRVAGVKAEVWVPSSVVGIGAIALVIGSGNSLLIALCGSLVTLLLVLPQLLEVLRRRRLVDGDVSGVALGGWLIFGLSNLCWAAFAVIERDGVMFAANTANLVLVLTLLIVCPKGSSVGANA
jgi:uncharacterized protein with PQ loop repeat